MIRQDHFESERDFRRYAALLGTTDLLVRHVELPGLFLELAQRLRQMTDCEEASFALYDSTKNVMQIHLPDARKANLHPIEVPADQSISGWVWHKQQPLIIPQQTVDAPCFPQAIEWLKKKGLNSYCTLPMTTSKRLGTIGLGSRRVDCYGRDEVEFLERLTELVAMAVENVISRVALQSQEDRLHMMLDVGSALSSAPDLNTIFPTLAQAIRNVMRPDIVGLGLYEKKDHTFRVYALDGSRAAKFSELGSVPFDQSLSAAAFVSGQTKIFTHDDLLKIDSSLLRLKIEQGIRCACVLPLIHGKSKLGALVLCAHAENMFQSKDLLILEQIASQVAATIGREQTHDKDDEIGDKPKYGTVDVGAEIRSEPGFSEIIGESAILKRTLSHIKIVSPSNATVLILGETGTGKELIARAIHRLSTRQKADFVKLNCAAIPTGLLESELFGHEKGAFTGAISQKIGRLEVADKGTLFLDEVGDIPLELQPKLLRVLQDQEFERLGGNKTIRVDVRLVAATNKDLARSVAEREFRADLYYRLNVFPIVAPALRERGTDVLLLARYFVQKYARLMNRQIDVIPADTLQALASWVWPGNVRELENFIERSVILSEGNVLNAPLSQLVAEFENAAEGTLESVEREHILRALRESSGVIAGIHGAAARLGLKRTTLQSRMQRMGIDRSEYEN